MRELFARIGLGLAGVAFALLAVEGMARVLGTDSVPLRLALLGTPRPTSVFHTQRGWANLPDSEGVLVLPDETKGFRLQTNRQGFRFSRDYLARKHSARRWAVVGDSQVYGFNAAPDAHLAELLDRARDDLEVYGFGVPGYGPVQEWLLLEEVLRDYEIDAAVVVAFLENDLNDAVAELAYGFLPKPYLRETAEGWKLENVPVPIPLPSGPGEHDNLAPSARLFAHSALYRTLALRGAVHRSLGVGLAAVGLGELRRAREGPDDRPFHYGVRRFDGRPQACGVVSGCPEERWLDGLPATVAAYERMRDSCASRRVRFLAVVSPAKVELEEDRFPITDALVAALSERGIDTLSLREPFRAEGGPQRFVRKDMHWTDEATRVVAERLLEALGE